jgi:cytochrome c-type biogenesis protein CcmE
MHKYGKFVALVAIIVGTMVWLGFSGSGTNGTYYKTIAELGHMGNQAYGKRLRVGGDVATGSIQRVGHEVCFMLKQDKQVLKVAYAGTDPLPDTFRDGAQALAEGKLGSDGTFHATKIQAKCASKYESKPCGMRPGMTPNINNGKSNI